MAQIAKGNEIFERVASALCSGDNVMGVEYAMRIALTITADLALLAVAPFDRPRKPLPMAT